MRFVLPAILLLLLLVPLLFVFIVWREQVRQKAVRLIGGIVQNSPQRIIPSRRWWKLLFWLLTLIALIVALARPVWGTDIDIVETQGVSLMFVLDVSNSMNAEDVLPSRLERAKLSLQEMFQSLSGNELGLILFAGTAFVQFPLTTDTASAQTFLKAASSSSISSQGTNIDSALQLALQSLNESTSAKRIIVLITDGENLQGDPSVAASEAAQQDVTIYTIGYGDTQGAPIPVRDVNGQITGYKSDATGNLILSSLDETFLKSLAGSTGGIYQHAAPDGQEARRMIDLINQSESSTLNRNIQRYDVERFEIFVLLAIFALTFEILLPESRRKAA